jgi:hypothetical protein
MEAFDGTIDLMVFEIDGNLFIYDRDAEGRQIFERS